MKIKPFTVVPALALALSCSVSLPSHGANPIVPGWYADPEIRLYGKTYWIYPTYSDDFGTPDRSRAFTPEQTRMRAQSDLIWEPYLKQTFLNAFSSPDLVNWTKH